MSTEMRSTVEEYSPNDLNENNTYQNSSFIEFAFAGLQFAVAFYGTPYDDEEHPYLNLVVNSEQGWIKLGHMGPMWRGALRRDPNPTALVVESYMDDVSKEFTALMKNYASANGEEGAILENWEKILKLLASIRVENGEIVV